MGKAFQTLLLPVALILGFAPGCRKGVQHPASAPAAVVPSARAGLDAEGRMQVGPEDRCAVCAMAVSEHAPFASAIALRDGRTFYFCGTGCMVRAWLHPERHLGAERPLLARAVVRDYFDGTHRDAARVVFVAGSDVVGPMGPAVVPLRPEDVATFTSRHGGGAPFRLDELDDARWEALTGAHRK